MVRSRTHAPSSSPPHADPATLMTFTPLDQTDDHACVGTVKLAGASEKYNGSNLKATARAKGKHLVHDLVCGHLREPVGCSFDAVWGEVRRLGGGMGQSG